MSLINFISDPKNFYKCEECSQTDNLAIIKGIQNRPLDLEGGFNVYEYSDIECKKPVIVDNLSSYGILLEDKNNILVFTKK